jgi:RNA polymerase sigma-54 factor
MNTSLKQGAELSQLIAPQMRQGLKMLAMGLPELRSEILREMNANPAIEEVESTLEKVKISDKEREAELSQGVPDYPEEDYGFDSAYVSGVNRGYDPDAVEKRQKFFENCAGEESETLEEHLLSQLQLSDIAEEDKPLAEMLIGDLNEEGYFSGSIPDIMMVTGASEEKILEVLSKISELDPLGCGARTHQECLLSQLGELADKSIRHLVRKLLLNHWEDMARGRREEIEKALSVSRSEYYEALKALRSLDPKPGLKFRSNLHDVAYINPVIHAVKCKDGWVAKADNRGIPKIRLSAKFRLLLSDPASTPETKAYVRERLQAARLLQEAVEKRHDTIVNIAQAVFDAQGGFFESGLKALKPLTMEEIAQKVGVHTTTVSRTVRDKYVSTPFGTIALRRFFPQGIESATGEIVNKDDVLKRVEKIIAAEDKSNPLSDEKISEILKGEGFPVARRTVAKYRGILGIPGTSARVLAGGAS